MKFAQPSSRTLFAPTSLTASFAGGPNRGCIGVLANASIVRWSGATRFYVPQEDSFGKSGRNILSAPGSTVVNLAVGRVFQVREVGSSKFRTADDHHRRNDHPRSHLQHRNQYPQCAA